MKNTEILLVIGRFFHGFHALSRIPFHLSTHPHPLNAKNGTKNRR